MNLNLNTAVDNMNKSFMKGKKNMFKISGAYGGYQVELTGKSKKVRGKYVFYGMGSAAKPITDGHRSAKETLAQLAMILSDVEGLKKTIKYWETVKQ